MPALSLETSQVVLVPSSDQSIASTRVSRRAFEMSCLKES